MFKENYFNDPNKFVNQPNLPTSGSTFHGKDSRGGYRKPYQHDRERDERKKREYVDFDDPARYQQQNPERQLVSYDDLF